MNEIAGEGALYVDPFSVDSVKKGLMTLLEEENLCNDLIKKGYENLSRFNPSKIVSDFLLLFQ